MIISTQVQARAFDVMAVLAATWPVGKRDAFAALAGLGDKMADMKLKGPAGDALTALSEACGPQFVATQLHKKAAAHKNPKVSGASLCLAVDDWPMLRRAACTSLPRHYQLRTAPGHGLLSTGS